MIDLNDLRQNPGKYETACEKKNIKFSIQEFLSLDAQVKSDRQAVEAMRSTQNAVSKDLPKLKGEEKNAKLAEMKVLAASLKDKEQALREIEEKWQAAQLRIPSPPLESVPLGKTDADNVPVRTEGRPVEFSFTPKDHLELGEKLDILDVERGVKIAGARSYFLKGDGARLQHAVLSLAQDLLHSRGYTLFDPPHIVRREAMIGTGYFPGGEEQAYHLDERDPEFHLIGTAEVPVTSYHYDEILDEKVLPLRYAGYSPCYRREAGTYGKDTRGIYRIHQFFKVEQVAICKADVDQSMQLHKELLKNAEDVLRQLEVPYRVVDVCTGDMGQGQVYKNDIETWMPSRKGYGETHSCSSFYDFQARRLNLRYKNAQGKNTFCYTLNNTCIASPRILIPILECHQQADGAVKIPAALRKYMGGQEVIEPRKG